jgi:hypothetical protein
VASYSFSKNPDRFLSDLGCYPIPIVLFLSHSNENVNTPTFNKDINLYSNFVNIKNELLKGYPGKEIPDILIVLILPFSF